MRREEGKRGRTRQWRCAGKAAQVRRAGGRGRNGRFAARQPQPGAEANVLGFRVAEVAAFGTASCAEGAENSLWVEGGRVSSVGALREVGGEDERRRRAARDAPLSATWARGRRGPRKRHPGHAGTHRRRGRGRPPTTAMRTQQGPRKKTQGGGRAGTEGTATTSEPQHDKTKNHIHRSPPATDEGPHQEGQEQTPATPAKKRGGGTAHGNPHTTPHRRRHCPLGEAGTNNHQGEKRTATPDGASRWDW